MRRPAVISLFALGYLALAAFNLLGVVSGVQRYTVLRDLPLAVPPAYLIVSSAVWAVTFALFGGGLWRLRGWARRGAPLVLALYLAQGWFDRLALARSDFARTTLPFHLALHLAVLLLVGGVLWWQQTRRLFSA